MKNGCRFTRQTLAGRADPAPTDYRFTDPMALLRRICNPAFVIRRL